MRRASAQRRARGVPARDGRAQPARRSRRCVPGFVRAVRLPRSRPISRRPSGGSPWWSSAFRTTRSWSRRSRTYSSSGRAMRMPWPRPIGRSSSTRIFADPWSLEGPRCAHLGRFDEAIGALAGCAARFPAATDCLKVQTYVFEQEGRCAEMKSVARAWLARDPASPGALGLLAEAMAATGQPSEAVRSVLERKWARLPAAQREHASLLDGALLDALAGDFAAAEKRRPRRWPRRCRRNPNEIVHRAHARLRVELAQEAGRSAPRRKARRRLPATTRSVDRRRGHRGCARPHAAARPCAARRRLLPQTAHWKRSARRSRSAGRRACGVAARLRLDGKPRGDGRDARAGARGAGGRRSLRRAPAVRPMRSSTPSWAACACSRATRPRRSLRFGARRRRAAPCPTLHAHARARAPGASAGDGGRPPRRVHGLSDGARPVGRRQASLRVRGAGERADRGARLRRRASLIRALTPPASSAEQRLLSPGQPSATLAQRATRDRADPRHFSRLPVRHTGCTGDRA